MWNFKRIQCFYKLFDIEFVQGNGHELSIDREKPNTKPAQYSRHTHFVVYVGAICRHIDQMTQSTGMYVCHCRATSCRRVFGAPRQTRSPTMSNPSLVQTIWMKAYGHRPQKAKRSNVATTWSHHFGTATWWHTSTGTPNPLLSLE